MKKYVVMCAICALTLPAFGAGRSMVGLVGAENTAHSAKGNSNTNGRMMTMSSNRLHPSTKITHGAVVTNNDNNTTGVSVVDDDPQPADAHALELAARKKACLDNNVGTRNTFVWASRDSNMYNYANMIEDTENPDNNTCFVNVGLQSKDTRVNISDVSPRYFKMGDTITCGSWVDETTLEKRILDGKKTVRVLSAVGASVAGAGIGVGIMEGFGNDLLAKSKSASLQKLGGQSALAVQSENLETWYRSKLSTLKDSEPYAYNRIVACAQDAASCCESSVNVAFCKQLKDVVVGYEVDALNEQDKTNANKKYKAKFENEQGWTANTTYTSYLDNATAETLEKIYFNPAEGKNSSKWKDAEGKFNTARLISDSIAGVVLGTVGGVVTGVVVKKNQLKKGFEDISCVVDGQIIGGYGDELTIDVR